MGLFTQKAVRERLKARVALDGPTGSGKTWTALQWARIIAGENPVGLIDTENRSAAHYSPEPGWTGDRQRPFDPPYDFFHFPVGPPYEPMALVRLIEMAADDLAPDGVLIIDSLSHFWEGEGGTLDQADRAGQRAQGNSFAGWKEATPMQRHMIDTIVHAPFHVIVTMRSKMEYVQETYTDSNGNRRSTIKKLGLAPVQRAGVEYEFTIVGDMDVNHRLLVSKSRCDAVADAIAEPGRSHEPAIAFRDWLLVGVERISADDAAGLVAQFDVVEDAEERKRIKAEFVAQFGRPTELLAERTAAAREWVANAVNPEPPTLTDEEPAAEPVEDAPTSAPAAPGAPESDETPSGTGTGRKSRKSAQGSDTGNGDGPVPVSGALADALGDDG